LFVSHKIFLNYFIFLHIKTYTTTMFRNLKWFSFSTFACIFELLYFIFLSLKKFTKMKKWHNTDLLVYI